MPGKLQIDPSELGARIKAARLNAGLTLVELQRKTGVNHSQQSRIERGEFKGYGRNVQTLCEFLGVAPVPQETDRLRRRLERAIHSAATRRALEALLDAVDASRTSG